MQGKYLVVAGIGTDVGKTVASALLCEVTGADYWKPVASGTDDGLVDHQIMPALLQNGASRIHPPRYVFGKSLSPHVAAALEGCSVELSELLTPPETSKGLVIELAGGVLVPLNDTDTNIDLVARWRYPVVVVSRHYLGSINHTLLTIEALRSRDVPIMGILFNGNELPDTERIIARLSGVPILGRIPWLESVTASQVQSLVAAQVVRLPEGL